MEGGDQGRHRIATLPALQNQRDAEIAIAIARPLGRTLERKDE